MLEMSHVSNDHVFVKIETVKKLEQSKDCCSKSRSRLHYLLRTVFYPCLIQLEVSSKQSRLQHLELLISFKPLR